MWILIQKGLAWLLFLIYDFLDTIGAIFNILTGTQTVGNGKTLLEVFVESAISTNVLIGLCAISIVITGACVGVKTVKNIVKIKSGGEPTSHVTTIKQGFIGFLSSVACIFFVFLFIAFVSMLLNMVNDVIMPAENTTLAQNLFNLSVTESYVIDEDVWEEREIGDYYDETGNRVQAKDAASPDGLAWEKDVDGNYVLDSDGNKIPVWVQKVERYHPYVYDSEGNLVIETGWCAYVKDGQVVYYTANDIKWNMTPDQVFGIHYKDWTGMFEQADQGYRQQPMVRLDAFNLFTAYLVAVIMLISMFMLSVGLVKRIYDIIVLIICMPLVCGTIPLDDGARFRAWRETFMSKLFVAFGAVIAINVFFMISGFIMGPQLDLSYLINEGILSSVAVTILKMLLLLGGALCMNGSQPLVARIFGTSADESREAMQAFSLITSGVRLAAVGALGVGRLALGGKNMIFGGTNRYGRERVGTIPRAFRGANALGEKVGGDKYSGSKGAAFVRALGRMGNGMRGPYGSSKNNRNGMQGPKQPQNLGGLNNATQGLRAPSGIRPIAGALRSSGNNSGQKAGAYNDNNRK